MQKRQKKEIWMLQTKKADFNGLAQVLGVSPVSVRIMRNRGMETEEAMRRYLYGTMDELYDGGLMKDMKKAVHILVEHLKSGKKIRIIGDYDIDGVCATYILLKALKRVEQVYAGLTETEEKQQSRATCIDYEIPDRIKDGYGINESIIRQAVSERVDLIITCDNGIAASKEIALAKEMGVMVIVTDHHDVPFGEDGQILPPADAVVNPKQDGDKYPFPQICGAVVAYKLIKELYRAAGVPDREWTELLEFAAIATVGDVMKLRDENRIIVKYGLRQMAVTKNIGLRKLMEKTGVSPDSLSAYHIGFVIGPCLNAGGRLQTAKTALRLLLSEQEHEADALAEELKELNDLRKDMTKQGEDEAIRQVQEQYPDDKVLVVYLPECHESLAGIIAGRIREQFHKPSFVLTKGEEMVKGSGRSIEAYHMFEALTRTADLLPKFGGHPMAAGLSIQEADVEEFRRRLNEQANLKEEDFIPKLWIDVPLPLEYISESLVMELKRLEPFGQGNEKPQFAQKKLFIRNVRILGKNRNLAKLNLMTESGFSIEGLLFCNGDEFLKEQDGRKWIDIIYYPDINEYNGNRTLQVVIKNYKFSEGGT